MNTVAIDKLTAGIKAQQENLKDFRSNLSGANYQTISAIGLESARTEGIIYAYDLAWTLLKTDLGSDTEISSTIMQMHMTRPLHGLSDVQLAYIDGERQGTLTALRYINFGH